MIEAGDLEAIVKVAAIVGSAASGALTTWALMRHQVAALTKAVEGGPDDWSVPEMRRQIKALWDRMKELQEARRLLELADANSEGKRTALEERVAEHAKRTIENGQKGYQALFDETLARMETILNRSGAKP